MTIAHLACRSHLDALVALPQAAFLQVVRTISEGLDSLDAETANQAAYALDNLSSSYVRLAKKETPAASALRAQVSANPGVFHSLMKILFQILVFSETQQQYILARPLLPTILAAELIRPDVSGARGGGGEGRGGGVRLRLPAPPRSRPSPHPHPTPSPQVLEDFKNDLVRSQPSDRQARMHDEFVALARDITRSLDVGNRDRFAQRLAAFRLTVRDFALRV